MNSYLLQLQLEAQIDGFKIDPTSLDDEERAEYVRWNVLALEDELHEMLDEIGWKPWATSKHFNRAEYMKELVDAYHFLMNLVLVAKNDEQSCDELAYEFVKMYQDKRKINLNRQRSGYDGVSGKCEQCGRAREDVDTPDNDSRIWHCICGHNNVEAELST